MGKERQKALTGYRYIGVIRADFSQNIIDSRKKLLLKKPFISNNIQASWEYPYSPLNLLYLSLFSGSFPDDTHKANIHNYNYTNLTTSLLRTSLKTFNNIDLRKFYSFYTLFNSQHIIQYNNINKAKTATLSQNIDGSIVHMPAVAGGMRTNFTYSIGNTRYTVTYNNIDRVRSLAPTQNTDNSMILMPDNRVRANSIDLTRNNQYYNLMYGVTPKSADTANIKYSINTTPLSVTHSSSNGASNISMNWQMKEALPSSGQQLAAPVLYFNKNKIIQPESRDISKHLVKLTAAQQKYPQSAINNNNVSLQSWDNHSIKQRKQVLIYDTMLNHKNRHDQNLAYSETPLLHYNPHPVSSRIAAQGDSQDNNEPVEEKITTKSRGNNDNIQNKPMDRPINLPSMDINNLVNEIYGRLESKLRVERERRGIFR